MMDAELTVGLSRIAFLSGAVLILILVALVGIILIAAKYATLKMDHEELEEKVDEMSRAIEKMQWEKEYARAQNGDGGKGAEK